MKKRRFKLNGIYKLIFLSYILVLILAMIFVGIFVKQAESILLLEISRANQNGLEKVSQQLDESLRSVESSGVELASSTLISNIVQGQNGVRDATDCYNSVDLVKQLWNARINNKFIERAYLMLYRDECVLSSDGKYTFDEFRRFALSGDDGALASTEFVSLHKQNRYKSYALIPSTDGSATDLFFMYALPLSGSISGKVACLGVQIDTEALADFLLSDALSDAALVLLDGQGNVIRLGTNHEALAEEVNWPDVIASENSRMNVEISGMTYCALSIPSQVNGWYYASLVPAHIYMSSQNQLNMTFAVVMCAMFAGVAAMSAYLARRQCEPIWKLVDIAGDKSVQSRKYNEYRLLETSISSILSENEYLTSENELKEDKLRNHYLCQIMQGMADVCEVESILKRCGMQLRSQGYQVWLVDMGIPRDEVTLAKARHVICEALSSRAEFAFAEGESGLYVLANLGESTLAADIRQSAEQVAEGCEAALNRQIDISISETYTGADRLHEGYIDVKRVADYRKLTGARGVLLASELPQGNGDSPVVYLIETNKLYNLLIIGNYAEAKIVFSNAMTELSSDEMPPQFIKCNMYGIIHTISRAFSESDVLTQKQYDGFMERLLGCEGARELERETNALLDELCQLEQSASDKQPSLTESAILYVQHNYTDVSLSVTSVAEAVGVSPVALSREFKKVLSQSVLDYIHITRLRAAKQLMAATSKSIAAIALETGYTNNVTFIRVFKKYEGVTPSQYREHISAQIEKG